jgi:hypothetical protein
MEPNFTGAIILPVFASTPLEAVQRLRPYSRDMRVPIDAIQISDRETGEIIGEWLP